MKHGQEGEGSSEQGFSAADSRHRIGRVTNSTSSCREDRASRKLAKGALGSKGEARGGGKGEGEMLAVRRKIEEGRR